MAQTDRDGQLPVHLEFEAVARLSHHDLSTKLELTTASLISLERFRYKRILHSTLLCCAFIAFKLAS